MTAKTLLVLVIFEIDYCEVTLIFICFINAQALGWKIIICFSLFFYIKLITDEQI